MTNRKSELATSKRLSQFRALEKETTDPFAARLVHEIVAELESRLDTPEAQDAPAQRK